GAIAKPLILTLLGEKWAQSIPYLQLLVFAGMLYPLHALNLNMLKVQGKTGLILRLQIIKKIPVILIVTIGVIWGIEIMIIGMIVNSFIGYFLNSYWSGKYIGYSTWQQFKDLLPSFIVAACMGGFTYLIDVFTNFNPIITLIIQISFAVIFIIGFCELINFSTYIFMKSIIKDKLKTFNK